MKSIFASIKRFARDEEGASASEYAILVAVLAAIIFIAVNQFDLNGIFNSAGTKVKNCINNAGGANC